MKKILISLFLIIPGVVCAGPHTVQKGETWEDIAKLYDINLTKLKLANDVKAIHSGTEVNIPLVASIYDLGGSHLFRAVRNSVPDQKKGLKAYQRAMNLQCARKMGPEEKIMALHEKAALYGNTKALLQLGRYGIYGHFYRGGGTHDFKMAVNSDTVAFTRGVECLQIAALAGEADAMIELAMTCGYEKSPIRNPYLCLSMLESFRKEYKLDVDDILYDMYKNGRGIAPDYKQAYLHCDWSDLVNKMAKTERESLMEKISKLQINFSNAKYGVGLDSETMMSIGLSYMHDKKTIEPEGIFWLHRAAYAGNADANWALASILQNKMYSSGFLQDDSNVEAQSIVFARKAAMGGNADAKKYVEAYDKYKQEQARIEKERREAEAQALAEKREQRRQMLLEIAGGVLQVAAITFAVVEANKHSDNGQPSSSFPQMKFGQMSDAQWQARNNLALQQIAQYTINKSYSDWTGTPMAPVNMSAVDLGTDMSAGSPLWMWEQQQRINSMATANAKMSCDIVAFYRQQADRVTQQIMTDPTRPVAGYFDYSGNWVSYDMVAADNMASAGNDCEHGSTRSGQEALEKVQDYYSNRYGNTECPICKGRKYCQTCSGSKFINYEFGAGKLVCPNCYKENGHNTGLCSKCHGAGYVYGLKP